MKKIIIILTLLSLLFLIGCCDDCGIIDFLSTSDKSDSAKAEEHNRNLRFEL